MIDTSAHKEKEKKKYRRAAFERVYGFVASALFRSVIVSRVVNYYVYESSVKTGRMWSLKFSTIQTALNSQAIGSKGKDYLHRSKLTYRV